MTMLVGHFKFLSPIYKNVEFLFVLPLNPKLYDDEESMVFRHYLKITSTF